MLIQEGACYVTRKQGVVGPLRKIQGRTIFGPQFFFDSEFFPGIWDSAGKPYGQGGFTGDYYGRLVCEAE